MIDDYIDDDEPTQRISLRDALKATGEEEKYSRFDVWGDASNGPGAWKIVGKEVDTGVWKTLRDNLHINTALTLLEA